MNMGKNGTNKLRRQTHWGVRGPSFIEGDIAPPPCNVVTEKEVLIERAKTSSGSRKDKTPRKKGKTRQLQKQE